MESVQLNEDMEIKVRKESVQPPNDKVSRAKVNRNPSTDAIMENQKAISRAFPSSYERHNDYDLDSLQELVEKRSIAHGGSKRPQ